MPRYRGNGRPASKPDSGATAFYVYGVRPARRMALDGSFRSEIVAIIQQRVPQQLDQTIALQSTDGEEDFIWFRGGATVIIDLSEGEEKVRLRIIKNTGGASSRRARRLICHHCSRPISATALLHASQGDDDG